MRRKISQMNWQRSARMLSIFRYKLGREPLRGKQSSGSKAKRQVIKVPKLYFIWKFLLRQSFLAKNRKRQPSEYTPSTDARQTHSVIS